MAAADKILRALLRSVELCVIYQLYIRELGCMVWSMYSIDSLGAKHQEKSSCQKEGLLLCLVNSAQTKFSNFLNPFKLLKRFSWSVILQKNTALEVT